MIFYLKLFLPLCRLGDSTSYQRKELKREPGVSPGLSPQL